MIAMNNTTEWLDMLDTADEGCVTAGPPSNPVLVLEFTLDGRTPADRSDAAIIDVVEALVRLERAMGGTGLEVESDEASPRRRVVRLSPCDPFGAWDRLGRLVRSLEPMAGTAMVVDGRVAA